MRGGSPNALPGTCYPSTCGAYGVCASPVDPVWRTDNLTSNRFNALPSNTLQVVLAYDGSSTSAATFQLEYRRPNGTTEWVTLTSIQPVNHYQRIITKEYDLRGVVPTGRVALSAMVADGVVDGVAFGLFWRDAYSQYHMLKSNTTILSTGASFAGAWPSGFLDDATFAAWAPQVTDPFARQTARATLDGAKFLPVNGSYTLSVY